MSDCDHPPAAVIAGIGGDPGRGLCRSCDRRVVLVATRRAVGLGAIYEWVDAEGS